MNSFRQTWTLQHVLKHTINCLLLLTSSVHIRNRANNDCYHTYYKIAHSLDLINEECNSILLQFGQITPESFLTF
jgi:hypothetical protein